MTKLSEEIACVGNGLHHLLTFLLFLLLMSLNSEPRMMPSYTGQTARCPLSSSHLTAKQSKKSRYIHKLDRTSGLNATVIRLDTGYKKPDFLSILVVVNSSATK